MSDNKPNSQILDHLLAGHDLDDETSRSLMKRWLNNFRPSNTTKDLVGSGFDTSN